MIPYSATATQIVKFFIPTGREPPGRKNVWLELTTYRSCTMDNNKEKYSAMRTVPLILRAWTGNLQFINARHLSSRFLQGLSVRVRKSYMMRNVIL